MAESAEAKTLSLSERYELKGKDEKAVSDSKPAEAETPAASDPVAAEPEEPPAAAVESDEVAPATAAEENSEASPSAEAEAEAEPEPEPEADPPAAEEESSDNAENAEYPSAKFFSQLETAPADFRFPTTNQTRHCFTRYVEYHRCVAVKGEDASDCNKFKKYYRSLCPDEWVERWDEQRENGTFPGPL